MILSVGRLSPVKDHRTLIKAIWLLKKTWHRNLRVVIIGGPATARDDPYALSLRQQIKRLGLSETVQLEPAVTMQELPSWYRRCAVVVNMTPTGSGDKVVWEAMACGALCLAANEGFRETLGDYADAFIYNYGDSKQLAERLNWVLSLPQADRFRIAAYLTQQVKSMHALTRLAQNLLCIFELVKRNNVSTAEPAKLNQY